MASEGLGIQGFLDSKKYEKVRPVYPKEAVQTFMVNLGVLKENGEAYPDKTFNILELGAGTGKFTRVMADVLNDANVRIIASDPGKTMCEQFKEVLPEIEIKQFSAENIDLESGSMDAVVSASAFHWFADKEESLPEIARVLGPNGKLGLTWFYPDAYSKPWLLEMYKYIDVFYQRQGPFGVTPLHQEEVIQVIPNSGKFGDLKRASFKTSFDHTSESFFQLLTSFSVLQVSNHQEKAEFEIFYRELMKKYFGEDEKKPGSVDYIMLTYWCQNN